MLTAAVTLRSILGRLAIEHPPLLRGEPRGPPEHVTMLEGANKKGAIPPLKAALALESQALVLRPRRETGLPWREVAVHQADWQPIKRI